MYVYSYAEGVWLSRCDHSHLLSGLTTHSLIGLMQALVSRGLYIIQYGDCSVPRDFWCHGPLIGPKALDMQPHFSQVRFQVQFLSTALAIWPPLSKGHLLTSFVSSGIILRDSNFFIVSPMYESDALLPFICVCLRTGIQTLLGVVLEWMGHSPKQYLQLPVWVKVG